jgi:excisionase family DNA binding protein
MIVSKLSDYVKVVEAAEILGVSSGTVRTWAADGKIPMHRNPANGYQLFKRSDMDKFLMKAAKPVNTLPEQTTITEVLTKMDGELAVLEQRREKMRTLKQELLS